MAENQPRVMLGCMREDIPILPFHEQATAVMGVLHERREGEAQSLLDVAGNMLNVQRAPLLALLRNTSPSHEGEPVFEWLATFGDATQARPVPTPEVHGQRPSWLDGVNENHAEVLPRPESWGMLRDDFLRVLTHPAVADTERAAYPFDSFAGGNTALASPERVGVIRDDGERSGLSIGQRVSAHKPFLNPYLGAQDALTGAYLDTVATGATPRVFAQSLASVEDSTGAWHLAEMMQGLADAGSLLGLTGPVGHEIWPRVAGHPSVSAWVVGEIADVYLRVGSGFRYPGDAILVLGETREDLSGSSWEHACHEGHLGGMPPTPRFDEILALGDVLRKAAALGLLSSALPLATGGLAAAFTRAALRRKQGFALTLPDADPVVTLFSETNGRVLVSLSGQHLRKLAELCDLAGVPYERLGEVTGEQRMEFVGLGAIELADARSAWVEQRI